MSKFKSRRQEEDRSPLRRDPRYRSHFLGGRDHSWSAAPRLCHSALQGRLRPHTRTPSARPAGRASCRCLHRGAELPRLAARGFEPLPRTYSRAQDTARGAVHGRTMLPVRSWRRAFPYRAILLPPAVEKGRRIGFVPRGRTNRITMLAIPFRRCNISALCLEPRVPTEPSDTN